MELVLEADSDEEAEDDELDDDDEGEDDDGHVLLGEQVVDLEELDGEDEVLEVDGGEGEVVDWVEGKVELGMFEKRLTICRVSMSRKSLKRNDDDMYWFMISCITAYDFRFTCSMAFS